MNYRTLGYNLVYRLYKNIFKVIALLKKRKTIALWQVFLIAIFGAIIFYYGSNIFQIITNKKDTYDFKIVISKIGIQKDINEGIDEVTLNKGPSHFPGTALPDVKNGNVVIVGHSAKTKDHDDPFGRLDELEKGDSINLIYKKEEYQYQVMEKKVVQSTDMSVIDPTKEPVLTLITCIKPDFPKDKRLIIRAQRL